MAVVLQTNFFTIYHFSDKMEIYNTWDVYKEHGLVLQNKDQAKELITICQHFLFFLEETLEKNKKEGEECQQ
jgi:hypothetical protein